MQIHCKVYANALQVLSKAGAVPDKLRLQVLGALKMLAGAARCSMKIREVKDHPGGQEFRDLMEGPLQDQLKDVGTARAALDVITEFAVERDLKV